MPESAPPRSASWAQPGSRHDSLVRWLKLGLPIVGVGLFLVLAVAPFTTKNEVSFLLDKNKADKAQERMRVEQARYTGSDDKGQPFEIVAGRALQRSSAVRVVDVNGIRGRLDLDKGPVSINAENGRYDLDSQKISVPGAIRVRDSEGYSIDTSGMLVDLKERRMNSSGQVSGNMRLGQFTASKLAANLGDRTVTLSGGARLKIVQGAVKGQ